MTALSLTVNGTVRTVDVSPWKRLLDVLREDLALTGTKEGCGEGECGACTVLLDGAPVCACLVIVGQAADRAVTTVEGLADGPILHAVQRELVVRGGAQCGICTPGIAVCAAAVVDRGALNYPEGLSTNPPPSGHAPMGPPSNTRDIRAQVRQLLAGNICRCTGYQLIVDAVCAAAASVAKDGAA